MKMLLLIPGLSFLILLIVLIWASYPWSLNEKIVKAEVLHFQPDGMVNNEEYPAVVKVQTWNLGFLYGIGSDGSAYEPKEKSFYEDKLNKLVEEIKTSAPDIICLQEIDFDSNRSYGINQARYLAIKAAYPYVAEAVGWNSNYVPFPYLPFSHHFGRIVAGGAILSKYPISSHQIHFLKKPLSKPWWYNIFYPHRYFQEVEIELGEKKVKLINLHLEAFDQGDRKAQAQLLVDKIKNEKIQLVAGDFNTLPLSATKKRKFQASEDDYESDTTYEILLKSELAEVIPDSIYALDESRYFTFPSNHPNRRLDYIFYDKSLKMIKAEVLPSALSDHLPLKATFQISTPVFNPYSQ